MSSKLQHIRPEHCQNCDNKLLEDDHYCAKCGQKALPDHLTLKYFIREFLSNYFSFDSKFLNTVKLLIIRPSFLSQEFVNGRRIRFINPIQLFIFASFLYFLVNSFMFLKEESKEADLVRFHDGEKNIINDSINIQESDSLIIIQDGANADTVENSFLGEFLRKGQEFNKLDKESQNEKISRNFSYAVFLLMPIFALYLGLFFRRKSKHYLEHIVFSLHFHSFYYVLGIVFLLTDRFISGDLDTFLLNALVWIYLLIAVKRFYQFKWFSTVFRLIGLTIIYSITVSGFLIVSILISILI